MCTAARAAMVAIYLCAFILVLEQALIPIQNTLLIQVKYLFTRPRVAEKDIVTHSQSLDSQLSQSRKILGPELFLLTWRAPS